MVSEPTNSVRRAQMLTKVHLPRSQARIASFMAIEPCVWLPAAPKRKQNSLCRWMKNCPRVENLELVLQISAKTKQNSLLPLHAQKLESDSVGFFYI